VKPLFSPEDPIAGRYRVVRFIASGGMGEVYEAQDLELQMRVALKIIRPEIAHDVHTIERFKREIRLARKVTHPNICSIFDVSHCQVPSHSDPEAPGAEIPFLSMELIEGETLGSRLWREERLSVDEALPLLRQIVAALAAAHRCGVVHRDLKSENVILVPLPEGGDRLVLTDFGLAYDSLPGRDLRQSLTGLGNLAGTPAYMSPEQVEGGEISAATDIYALGIVMYEMVTGVRPFDGGLPMQVAMRRLQEEPPSPRIHVPELDPGWESVILRCLRRLPEERFASVEAVLEGLESKAGPTPRERRRRAGILAAVLSGAMLLGVLCGYWLDEARPRPGAEAQAVGQQVQRRSVAVLGLENLSGSPDVQWLSEALAEMLTAELAGLGAAPRQGVLRSIRELGLDEAGGLGPAELRRLQARLGADVLVMGSYLVLEAPRDGLKPGRRIRLDLRLQDARSARILASSARTGALQELFSLVTQAGAGLRERLEAWPPAAEQLKPGSSE
jgi:eukaryotic-like serine/threonine-protein kinase